MNDRAEEILAALHTGSWKWSMGRESGTITAADLRHLYRFLAEAPEGRSGAEIAAFLGIHGMSHRKADRSVQLLSRFGLAWFGGSSRRWRVFYYA